MNILEKTFCRTYQFGFRAAMPVLPYHEPKTYNSIEKITDILKNENKKCVLIVSDQGIRQSGIIDILTKILNSANIKYAVYDKTRANPTIDNIEEGLTLYKKSNCDSLIAIGGGSSMDCAKAIGARVVYPQKSIEQMKGLMHVLKKIPTLITIPTTAGTGSEVTVTAVITDPVKKHKYTLNNFTFIPYYAILDPKLTVSLPPSLTATTGMDALTHAVEAYIGRSTTRQTRKLALDATKLVFENILNAYTNGLDINARANMLMAAYKAGMAFSKSYVGYIHAIAHSLGGQYNIAHGLANAVLMPYVLEGYGKTVYKKLHKLAIASGLSNKEENSKIAAEKFISAIKDLNKKMNIPANFDIIETKDIPQMAKYAAKEANPLYPVPKLMNRKELEKFYYQVKGNKNGTK
jgi:alcohol dehydrogenase class IV